MERYDAQYVSVLAYIVWEIWKHQNAAIFEEKPFHFHEVINKSSDNWAASEKSREKEPMQEWRRRD